MGIFRKVVLVCLVLTLGASLLPGAVIAVEPPPVHWAADSVDKLNALYGPDTFSDNYEEMVTIGDLKHLLGQTFKCSDLNGYIGVDEADDIGLLTRGVLVHTVVKLFNLGKIDERSPEAKVASAIAICKEKGIVSGYPDGTFGEHDPVTNGMLSVVFYRTINKAAGSVKPNQWGLIPGAYGYEELMYFSVRRIPFGEDVYNRPFDDRLEIDVDNTNITGAAIVWERWGERLNELTALPEDIAVTTPAAIEFDFDRLPDHPKTVDAVVEMVKQYREFLSGYGLNTGIFSDVPPSSWFYEGIMYLYNQGIVVGTGDGKFSPGNSISRGEMAALILRAKGVDITSLPEPDMEEFTAVFPHPDFIVEAEECNNETPHAHPHFDWSATFVWAARAYYGGVTDFSPREVLSREAMACAAVELFEGYDENNVNLSILDRFADRDDIGVQYKKPLAFLVSIGTLNGSPGGDGKIYLNPKSTCTRAETGVFLARVLQGLDKSKMQDYREAVNFVKESGGAE